jgi:hypothetical protein
MAYSSIVGADTAPAQPSGRSSDLLGPSDNSDSGSDALGTEELHGDSDSTGTGERGVVTGIDGKEGGDILPDRVVRLGPDDGSGEGGPDAGSLDEEFTDLDDNPDATEDDSGP